MSDPTRHQRSFYRGTCHDNLVTRLVIIHERGKNREVFTTSGTYLWSFATLIFYNTQPCHGGDRKTFSNLTKRNPWFSSFLVSSSSCLVEIPKEHKGPGGSMS